MKIKYYVLLAFLLFPPLFSQAQLSLDSVQSILQRTEIHEETGQKYLSIEKESQFDTNQILIFQNRHHFNKKGAKTSYYEWNYTPRSRKGEHFTLRYKKGELSSKIKTTFYSYDHHSKFTWTKQYDEENILKKETHNEYDEYGLLAKTYYKDFSFQPTITHIDEIRRNDHKQLLEWKAFDEEEGKKTKVRHFKWEYMEDTLLLKSSGYMFSNWNETINQYKKNNQLLKSTKHIGYRQDDGSIIRNHKIITTYKNNQASKTIEYDFSKKKSTILYEYSPGKIKKTYHTKTGINTKTSIKIYNDSNQLLRHEELENDTTTLVESFSYRENLKLEEHQEIEYQKNGISWKTVTSYNIIGNPVKKIFYIQDKIKQEDSYQYEYYSN